MRHALVFNIISLVTFLLAVFFLATAGLQLLDRVHRRHGDRGELRQAGRRRPRPRGARQAPASASTQVQNFGSSRDVLIRLPLKDGRVERRSCRSRSMATLQGRRPGGGAAARRVRRPAGRAELAENGALALLLASLGIVALPRAALRMAVRRRGDHRQPARRRDHPRLLRVLPVGVLAAGAGGGAGGARLLGERVGGDRRPDPRELPQDAQGARSTRSSTTRSRARCRARSSPTAARR